MDRSIIARWSDWGGAGSEHLVLRRDATRILAESVVVSGGQPLFALHYRIECDLGWRVRRAEIALLGDDRRVMLEADGEGRWEDGGGRVLDRLDGAIDLDLSASPFTNTLPIRRLGLRFDESAEIRAAYVAVPEMTVWLDPQRYTCLDDGHRYRYDSLDGDFTRDIEVDEHGLVVVYPGLFCRVS